MNHRPSQSKREHLRDLVRQKQRWSEPLSDEERAKGFRGWHERGYLPHCDFPGLTQFVTLRLVDSMPESRRGEWEHLLAALEQDNTHDARNGVAKDTFEARAIVRREQRQKLEEYLDRSHGKCHLRYPQVACLVESAIQFHHEKVFRLLAWVVMPNHLHVLLEIWHTPLSKILQNWKSITAVEANKIIGRDGSFWQKEYWDMFMRDDAQTRRGVLYIENNPVKAKLCRCPEDWPFSSARFRDPQTRELKFPT